MPKLPILFNKFNNALNNHMGMARISAVPAEKFYYEAELVIVMSRRAHNVSDAAALTYLFGYCNGNDLIAPSHAGYSRFHRATGHHRSKALNAPRPGGGGGG
jgi:2-keto-4-pentenoate hydratase/2-oxohepta-3-ene-1,7-dioic acid hydratase in catechol pathway